MPGSFPINRLDYDLPEELIAQQPAPQREASRLLVMDRTTGQLADARFTDLPSHLQPGDLLVLNDTRVVPAKFLLRRRTGGRLKGLYLRELEPGRWEVLLDGARRLQPGESLTIEPESAQIRMEIETRVEAGRWHVRVSPAEPAEQVLARVGSTPLPPYIHRPKQPDDEQSQQDRSRYQTVYSSQPGAVAAPTAGLHFTEDMLETLTDRGIETARVTLHVGLGTFAPVQVDDLRDHQMHSEWYDLPALTAEAVAACRQRSRRVVAVGTTSVRVLEACSDGQGTVRAGQGWTNLFCYPPYEFTAVDALLTNFHLPRSTLLALVMAFAGIEPVAAAYRHAVTDRYRFFSYGDAMLIV